MIEGKRIDALIENAVVANWALETLKKPGALRDAGSTNAVDNIYLAFSGKRPSAKARFADFEAGLATITANGKLAAIYAKYGVAK